MGATGGFLNPHRKWAQFSRRKGITICSFHEGLKHLLHIAARGLTDICQHSAATTAVVAAEVGQWEVTEVASAAHRREGAGCTEGAVGDEAGDPLRWVINNNNVLYWILILNPHCLVVQIHGNLWFRLLLILIQFDTWPVWENPLFCP
jgi:hypothetical protein